MLARPTPRLLAAAALCAALVLGGQLSVASGQAPSFDRTDRQDEPQVLPVGDERVRLVPVGKDGLEIVEPLPGEDGTTPGLLVSRDEAGTTLQSLEGTGAPTVVAGSAPATMQAGLGKVLELRLDAIGRDGRPASADVTVFDVVTGAIQGVRRIPGDPDAECTEASWAESSCLLVPPGTYSVMAFVNTMPAGRPSTTHERTVQNISLVGEPEVELTAARTFTFDARLARLVDVRTPGHRTEVTTGGAMLLGYTRTSANGQTIDRYQSPASMLDENFYLQPTAPVSLGELETRTRLRLAAPDIELSGLRLDVHPAYYEPVWFSDVSVDFPVYDGHARLRVVDIGHATPAEMDGLRLDGAIAVAERSDDVSVADQSNAAARAGADLVVIHNDGPGDNDDPNGTGTRLQVPTVRLSRAEGLALTGLPGRSRVDVRGESASPYLYDLVLKEQGHVPADLSYVIDRDDLAQQVRQLHGQPTVGSTLSEAAFAYQPGDTFAISTMSPFRGGARSRVEYRLPDPDTRWTYAVATPETRYNALFPEEPVLRMILSDPDLRAYSTTERIIKPVATAPITAGPKHTRPMQRSGDWLRVAIAGFVDADGNHGTSYTSDSGMSTLLQIRADGVVIGETGSLPDGIVTMPPGESTVEVTFRADNPQSWTELSTHTESVWTFRSSSTPAGSVVTEPVLLADYDADVDLRNRLSARGRRGPEIDIRLSHARGAATAPIDEVAVDASYDDGRTWRPAGVTIGAGGRQHVELPQGTGFVSLRLHAADTAGSALDQTIIRALYVKR